MEETAPDDPKTYKQVMKLREAEEWKKACAAQVASLTANKVFTLVDKLAYK